MALFGGPGLQQDQMAKRASQRLQKAINPHRPPDGVPDLGPRGDLKEARKRYERENPSRLRWLFKIGEWFTRHI